MVRPKKHLGQHFLHDKQTAQKIAKACLDLPVDHLLEIGPGTGAITNYLLEGSKTLRCLDVDEESIKFLKKAYPDKQDAFVLDNFLSAVIKSHTPTPVGVVGNFPYNVSSQIVFKILENRQDVPHMVGMFQKEVADRICSTHGSKIYGILSVLTQAYYNTDYLFTVGKGAFSPPPNIQSAVIRLDQKAQPFNITSDSFFFQLVKMAFNQRRKTLRNAIKALINPTIASLHEETLSKRAEQLSVEEFVTLSNDCFRERN